MSQNINVNANLSGSILEGSVTLPLSVYEEMKNTISGYKYVNEKHMEVIKTLAEVQTDGSCMINKRNVTILLENFYEDMDDLPLIDRNKISWKEE